MISLKTHKLLWGRSGNMCAFPGCKKVLVIDETETDDPSVIGEEAHIVAQKEKGARGESDLPIDQRDKYGNLILLCSIHHKIIDDQEVEYTVEKLQEYKKTHELWVSENLARDPQKVKDDELYASYIDKITTLADFENWKAWTSWFLGGSETISKEMYDNLSLLQDYIVSRIWPKRYAELEDSIINFKNVLHDFVALFSMYLKESHNSYGIERFYRNYRSPEDYQVALDKYNNHVLLLEDLLIELTRAANYICDYVRKFIFEGYRIEEGALLITRGDIMGYQNYRVEYKEEERVNRPYESLKKFMEIRTSRDLCFGEGVEEDYFKGRYW